MFLLHFQTPIYLQRVHLDVSINWYYLHQDAGKAYLEISKMTSYWKSSKATICRNMKKNIADLVVMKASSGKTTKTVCSKKEKQFTTKQAPARKHCAKKTYFSGPGISQKAQKVHVKIIFPSTFQLRKRPYLPSPKRSKQEHLSYQ